MPRLFALDKNFPQPIVGVLSDFQIDAGLVPLDQIDPRMSTLDDWELLLALYHHAEPWDGLITTDSSMLSQGHELAALIQTRLTLVVAVASGHNPVKASGLLFAYLAGICQRTTRDRAQVWRLNAANRPPDETRLGGLDEVVKEFRFAASRMAGAGPDDAARCCEHGDGSAHLGRTV